MTFDTQQIISLQMILIFTFGKSGAFIACQGPRSGQRPACNADATRESVQAQANCCPNPLR